MDTFYSKEEIKKLGFRSIGENVLLSRNASVYCPERISIGDNVRIDDFCILSGDIIVRNNVHISAGVYLYAGNTGIDIGDFVGISSRSCVYAESDDYSGEYLIGPMVPEKYRNVIKGRVVFEKYSVLGTCCTVLPNVNVGEGASVGSMTLVNKSLEPWGIYVGIPCKKIKDKKTSLLTKVNEFKKDIQ